MNITLTADLASTQLALEASVCFRPDSPPLAQTLLERQPCRYVALELELSILVLFMKTLSQ